MSTLALRLATPADRPFIHSTWLKGQRFNNPFFAETEPTAYYAAYGAIVDRILDNPTTTVAVACLSDEPDVIVGYSVTTAPGILHWVYVKKQWRKNGVAKMLVADTIKTVTAITYAGLQIAKKRKYTFNPFI